MRKFVLHDKPEMLLQIWYIRPLIPLCYDCLASVLLKVVVSASAGSLPHTLADLRHHASLFKSGIERAGAKRKMSFQRTERKFFHSTVMSYVSLYAHSRASKVGCSLPCVESLKNEITTDLGMGGWFSLS